MIKAALFKSNFPVIRAMQWTGDNIDDIKSWIFEYYNENELSVSELEDGTLKFITLMSDPHRVFYTHINDWVIRGSGLFRESGHFEIVPSAIFKERYEAFVAPCHDQLTKPSQD